MPPFIQKNRFQIFAGFALVLFIISCQNPANKKEYIQDFKSFVQRVEKHHDDYRRKDWQWADEKFDKFSTDWYDEFEDDLTPKEKLEVVALKLKYEGMKEPSSISRIFKKLKKENLDEIKNAIDDYIDNDFDEDVDEIVRGMTEIGDSAVKAIENIVEEIDNQF